MGNICKNVLSAASNQNTNGTKVDSGKIVAASFHIFFGDTSSAGTFKIQASNDPNAFGSNPSDVTPVQWVDIPSATKTIAAGAPDMIPINPSCYRWLRAVYTSTAVGVQTITTIADVAGSLNSKYFLINAGNNGVGYYVWMNVNSAGVDPAVAGRTGVEIAVATGDSAATIATSVAAALDALSTFASTAVGAVATVTNSQAGPFTPGSDVSSGFTIAQTSGGTSTANVNMNAMDIDP